MAEYIEREAAIRFISSIDPKRPGDDKEDIIEIAENGLLRLPAADVAPVVRGEWVDRSDKDSIHMTHPYVCNRCGRVEMLKEPYCNCGAKMRGEER